jgi:Protein of unknown function (DUF3014)
MTMTDTHTDRAEARIDWTKVAGSLVALVAVAAGFYAGLRWLLDNRTRPAPPPVAVVAPPTVQQRVAPGEPAPGPQHRVQEVPTATQMTLGDSDAALLEEISRLSIGHGLMQWLLPSQVVRHIVATVDALPRRQVPVQVLPTRPVPGSFMVAQHGDETVIGSKNGERYLPYVRLLASIDPQAAASLYRRFYPLFQQAYRELGYPTGYFNDRLVEAIDDVLATPDVPSPLRVEAPSAMWRYVDPDLEALSAGQKILLRMGQPNAQIVRRWLNAFRASVA